MSAVEVAGVRDRVSVMGHQRPERRGGGGVRVGREGLGCLRVPAIYLALQESEVKHPLYSGGVT